MISERTSFYSKGISIPLISQYFLRNIHMHMKIVVKVLRISEIMRHYWARSRGNEKKGLLSREVFFYEYIHLLPIYVLDWDICFMND